jgi:hypothetical protein
MPPIVGVITQFVIGAAIIVFAGVRLSLYDVIAEKSGAGGTWVGLTLLIGLGSWPRHASRAARAIRRMDRLVERRAGGVGTPSPSAWSLSMC